VHWIASGRLTCRPFRQEEQMLVRLARTLGWDRNPLRRRTDRIETVILTGLLGIFLIGAPVVAIMARHAALASGIQQQREERTWRQVPAVVQDRAAARPYELYGGLQDIAVLARWTTSGGHSREGWVLASQGARRGSRVRVWVNGSGMLTGPPLPSARVTGLSELAGVLAPAGLAAVLCTASCAGRFVLNRRRLAGWDRAWRAVGPQWSRWR
jgi:hypothetical protein